MEEAEAWKSFETLLINQIDRARLTLELGQELVPTGPTCDTCNVFVNGGCGHDEGSLLLDRAEKSISCKLQQTHVAEGQHAAVRLLFHDELHSFPDCSIVSDSAPQRQNRKVRDLRTEIQAGRDYSLHASLLHVTNTPSAGVSSTRKRKAQCTVLTSESEAFTGSPHKLFIVALSQTDTDTMKRSGTVSPPVPPDLLGCESTLTLPHKSPKQSSETNNSATGETDDDESHAPTGICQTSVPQVTTFNSPSSKVSLSDCLIQEVSISLPEHVRPEQKTKENQQFEQVPAEDLVCAQYPKSEMAWFHTPLGTNIKSRHESTNIAFSFVRRFSSKHDGQKHTNVTSLFPSLEAGLGMTRQESYAAEKEGSEYDCDFIYRVLHPVQTMQGPSLHEELVMAEKELKTQEATTGDVSRDGHSAQNVLVDTQDTTTDKHRQLLHFRSTNLANQGLQKMENKHAIPSTTVCIPPQAAMSDATIGRRRKKQVYSCTDRKRADLDCTEMSELTGPCVISQTDDFSAFSTKPVTAQARIYSRNPSPDSTITESEFYDTADENNSLYDSPTTTPTRTSCNSSRKLTNSSEVTNPLHRTSKELAKSSSGFPFADTEFLIRKSLTTPRDTTVCPWSVTSTCGSSERNAISSVSDHDTVRLDDQMHGTWQETGGYDEISRSFLMRQRMCRASFSDSCLSVCQDAGGFGDSVIDSGCSLSCVAAPDGLGPLHDYTKEEMSLDSFFSALSYVADCSPDDACGLVADVSVGEFSLSGSTQSTPLFQPGHPDLLAVCNNNAAVLYDGNTNAAPQIQGKSTLCRCVQCQPKETSRGHFANIPLRGVYPHPLQRLRYMLHRNNNSLPSTSKGASRGTHEVRWDANTNYFSEEDYSLSYKYNQRKVAKSRSPRMRASHSLPETDLVSGRGSRPRSARPLPARSLTNLDGETNQNRVPSPSRHSSNCKCLHFDCLRRRGEMLHRHIMQNLHLLKSFAADESNQDSLALMTKGTTERSTQKCNMERETPCLGSYMRSRPHSEHSRHSSPSRLQEKFSSTSRKAPSQSQPAECFRCSSKCPSPQVRDKSQENKDLIRGLPSPMSSPGIEKQSPTFEDHNPKRPMGISISVKSDISDPTDVMRSQGRIQQTIRNIQDCDKFLRRVEENRRRTRPRVAQAENLDSLPRHIPASIRHNKTCLGETCKCKTRSARSSRTSLGKPGKFRRSFASDFCDNRHDCRKSPLSCCTYSLYSCDECRGTYPQLTLVPTAWCRDSKWPPGSRARRSPARRRGPLVTYTELETKEIITRPDKHPRQRQVETHKFTKRGKDATSYFYNYSRENLPENEKGVACHKERTVCTDTELCKENWAQTEDKPKITISSETRVLKDTGTSPRAFALSQKETQTACSFEDMWEGATKSSTKSVLHSDTNPLSTSAIPCEPWSQHMKSKQTFGQRPTYKSILVKSKSPEPMRVAFSGNKSGGESVTVSRDDLSIDSLKTSGTVYSAMSSDASTSKIPALPNKNPNRSLSTPFSSGLSVKINQSSLPRYDAPFLARPADPKNLVTQSDTAQGYYTVAQSTTTALSDLLLTKEEKVVGDQASSHNSISHSTDSMGPSTRSATHSSNRTSSSTFRSSPMTRGTECSVPRSNEQLHVEHLSFTKQEPCRVIHSSDSTSYRPAEVHHVLSIAPNSLTSRQTIAPIQHNPASPFSPVRVSSHPASPINISSSPFSPIQESSRSPSPSHQSDRTVFFSNQASRSPSPSQRNSVTPSSAYQSIIAASPINKTSVCPSKNYEIKRSVTNAGLSAYPKHDSVHSSSPIRESKCSPSASHQTDRTPTSQPSRSVSPAGQCSHSASSTHRSNRSASPDRQSSRSLSPAQDVTRSFSLRPLLTSEPSAIVPAGFSSDQDQSEQKDQPWYLSSPTRMTTLYETRESPLQDTPLFSAQRAERPVHDLSQELIEGPTSRSSQRSLQSTPTSFTPEVHISGNLPCQSTLEITFQPGLESSSQSTRASSPVDSRGSSPQWSREPSPVLPCGSPAPSSVATSMASVGCALLSPSTRNLLGEMGADFVSKLASVTGGLAHVGNRLGRSVKQVVNMGLTIALLSCGLAFCNRCCLSDLSWEASLGFERILEDMIKHVDLRHIELPPQ